MWQSTGPEGFCLSSTSLFLSLLPKLVFWRGDCWKECFLTEKGHGLPTGRKGVSLGTCRSAATRSLCRAFPSSGLPPTKPFPTFSSPGQIHVHVHLRVPRRHQRGEWFRKDTVTGGSGVGLNDGSRFFTLGEPRQLSSRLFSPADLERKTTWLGGRTWCTDPGLVGTMARSAGSLWS